MPAAPRMAGAMCIDGGTRAFSRPVLYCQRDFQRLVSRPLSSPSIRLLGRLFRSWGDKVVGWLRVQLNVSEAILRLLEPGYGINPAACLVSMAMTLIVMKGIKESKVSRVMVGMCVSRIPTRRISQYCFFRISKIVTDFFTWIKVFLVAFMIVGGFVLFDRSNFEPFVPPEFGATGVLRGAVSTFFGYLGFDAMACVAGEAINAERNLPLSIMITLAVVTTLYVAAAIALVGMQSYRDISPESGFPGPFSVLSHDSSHRQVSQLTVWLFSGIQKQRHRVGVSANGIWGGVYTACGCPDINYHSTKVTICIRLVM